MCGCLQYCDPRNMGEQIYPMIRWAMCKPVTSSAKKMCIVVYCNNVPICTKCCCTTAAISWGGFTPVCGVFYDRKIDYNDTLSYMVHAEADTTQSSPSISKICLDGLAVAYTIGCYCVSSSISERCHVACACKCGV